MSECAYGAASRAGRVCALCILYVVVTSVSQVVCKQDVPCEHREWWWLTLLGIWQSVQWIHRVWCAFPLFTHVHAVRSYSTSSLCLLHAVSSPQHPLLTLLSHAHHYPDTRCSHSCRPTSVCAGAQPSTRNNHRCSYSCVWCGVVCATRACGVFVVRVCCTDVSACVCVCVFVCLCNAKQISSR